MLCKKTIKNQITLPKKIMDRFRNIEYFEAEAKEDKIILIPVKIRPARGMRISRIRDKISSLGMSEKDIQEAIEWARRK